MTKINRYQVSANHLKLSEELPYPSIMGYYDASGPDDAFKQFLQQHAPNIQKAQWFFDEIMVIPVPKDGYLYKLSSVYGEVARFPNHKYLEDEGTE